MKPLSVRSLLLVSLFFILAFTSCSESFKNDLHEILVGADKINIYFYDKEQRTVKDPKMMVVISEQDNIEKIIESITAETSEQYKCGYSGQLEIYKDGKLLLDSEFNFEEEYRHYVFTYKGKVLFRVMTKEGSVLLKEYYEIVTKD